jgi:MoxR-like ATPase
MGLDMYLHKKTYVKNWDYMKPEELHQIIIKKGGKKTAIKPERISEIVEEVAYWRKVNEIHAWFVKNVQNGVDDCGDYYVSREELQELLETVSKVLKNHKLAAELLPTQSGFFFGDTDYDQYYYEDLADTKKMLTEIVAEGEATGSYYYCSSW